MIKSLFFPVLKRFWKLYLSVFIIGILCTVLLLSLSFGFNSFKASADCFLNEYGKADLVVDTVLINGSSFISDIKEIAGVRKVQNRLCFDTVAKNQDGRYFSIRVFTYRPENMFSFFVMEGDPMTTNPKVMLDYRFANNNKISPGDKFTILLKNKEFVVSLDSTITSSDSLAIQPFDYMFFENADYGYAYISRDLLSNTEYQDKNNQIMVSLKDGADKDRVISQIKQILGVENIHKITEFNSSISKKKIDRNQAALKIMSIDFPLVFFAIAMVVIYLLISLLMKQYRKELFILFSQGTEKRKVVSLFFWIMLFCSVLSFLIGFILSVPLSKVLAGQYLSHVGIPVFKAEINLKILFLCLVSIILTMELPALFCINKSANLDVSDFYSGKKLSKTSIPHSVSKSHLSPLAKVNLYSFVHSKGRLIFSILCFAATIIILFSSLAFRRSKEEIVPMTFGYRQKYNTQLIYESAPDKDFLESIDMNYLLVPVHSCRISSKNKEVKSPVQETVNGKICQENIIDMNKNKIEHFNGIVLPSKLAHELKVKAGDFVLCNDHNVKIAAISDQRTNFECFVSDDIILTPPDAYFVYLNSENQNELLEKAVHSNGYMLTLFSDVLKESNISLFRLYDILIAFLLLFGIICGAIINTNTLYCVILERKKEFSVLLSQGIEYRDIGKTVLLNELCQLVISLIIGIPIGIQIIRAIAKALSNDNNWFYPSWGIKEILLTVGFSVVFIIIGNEFAVKEMKHWNLSQEIKDRE